MAQSPKVSIVITSYNQATTLEFLLESLVRQTTLFSRNIKELFEVIVADDGSSDSSATVCQKRWGFPVHFVTQEDRGYRKAKILNKALHHVNGDYILFLDADVILERHFVEDHLYLRKEAHFVCGRRVDLGPEISQKVNIQKVREGYFDSFRLEFILSGVKGDSQSIKRAIRIKSPLLRKGLGYERPLDLLGSNFSAWKKDILAVNGFNESLQSYWGEDGDLYIRLRNKGIQAVGAKSLCIQYHVFHKRREPSLENIRYYEEKLKDVNYQWAPQGYRESGP